MVRLFRIWQDRACFTLVVGVITHRAITTQCQDVLRIVVFGGEKEGSRLFLDGSAIFCGLCLGFLFLLSKEVKFGERLEWDQNGRIDKNVEEGSLDGLGKKEKAIVK